MPSFEPLLLIATLAVGATALSPGLEASGAALAGAAPTHSAPSGLSVAADRSGRHRVQASVNDRDVNFLLDTGATQTVIGNSAAQRLGLAPGGPKRRLLAVGGTVYARTVTARSFKVEGRDIGSLNVLVVEGWDTSLLGQDALRRLGPITLVPQAD